MNPLLLPKILAAIARNFDRHNARKPSLVYHAWSTAFSPIIWRRFGIDNAKANRKDSILWREDTGIVLAKSANLIRELQYDDIASVSRWTPPCTKLTELKINSDESASSEEEAAEHWDHVLRLIQDNKGLRCMTLRVPTWLIPVSIWAALAPCTSILLDRVQMDQGRIRLLWETAQTFRN